MCSIPHTAFRGDLPCHLFLGAVYLSRLDQRLEKLKGIQYFRYMDDILVLAQTRHQYRRAKKILFEVLKELKLYLAPSKTWMGTMDHGFHFLGVMFEVPRSPQAKLQASAKIHPRSCARALDKVNALRNNAIHPAIMQRYLIRCAA
jgi:RNA-directed DNA polymerase